MVEASHESLEDQAAEEGKRLRWSSMVVCDALSGQCDVLKRFQSMYSLTGRRCIFRDYKVI